MQLSEIETALDANQPARDLVPVLRNLLSSLTNQSPERPHALRLMAVAKNRLKLWREALAHLAEARAAAAPDDWLQLSAICRETGVVHAWRGDHRAAAIELLNALVLALMSGNSHCIAWALAEAGRMKMEAGRFDEAIRFFAHVADAHVGDLPQRQIDRIQINLCQALNRLARHDEALKRIQEFRSSVPVAADQRLTFLALLEEARAHGGLKQSADAEAAAAKAAALVSSDTSFEHTELMEVQGELSLGTHSGGIEKLNAVAEAFRQDRLTVREVGVRLNLATALMLAGRESEARAELVFALRSAIAADLDSLADEVRARLLAAASADEIATLPAGGDLDSESELQRYVLLGLLGKGGFGVVHRAIDLRDGLEVAIKIIDIGDVSDVRKRSQLAEMVVRERRATCALVHPGIARVRVLHLHEQRLYVVQDFVSGQTLRAFLNGPCSLPEMLLLLASVTDTLDAVHQAEVVHRDLKPENIVLRSEKQPVLIDFGLSSMDGAGGSLRRAGTPPYAAPEQLMGADASPATDIYALGVMIHEICATQLSGRWLRWPALNSRTRAICRIARSMRAADPRRRLTDYALISSTLRAAAREPVSG